MAVDSPTTAQKIRVAMRLDVHRAALVEIYGEEAVAAAEEFAVKEAALILRGTGENATRGILGR